MPTYAYLRVSTDRQGVSDNQRYGILESLNF